MPLVLNNNRGSVYSGRMKIEVLERYCLTGQKPWIKHVCGISHVLYWSIIVHTVPRTFYNYRHIL